MIWPIWKSLVFSKRWKLPILWLSNSSQRYTAKRNECMSAIRGHGEEHARADWLIIAKDWKQPKCPLALKWINYGLFVKWNITQQFKNDY